MLFPAFYSSMVQALLQSEWFVSCLECATLSISLLLQLQPLGAGGFKGRKQGRMKEYLTNLCRVQCADCTGVQYSYFYSWEFSSSVKYELSSNAYLLLPVWSRLEIAQLYKCWVLGKGICLWHWANERNCRKSGNVACWNLCENTD